MYALIFHDPGTAQYLVKVVQVVHQRAIFAQNSTK